MERILVGSLLYERVAADRRAHLCGGSEHHRNSKAETGLNLTCNSIGKPFCRRGSSFEEHIAALNVGAHVLASGLLKERGEIAHGQHLLAADIDPSQQRQVCTPLV